MTPPDAKTRARHRIGGYRVIAPIGAGGFATVYRALDENTKTEVAIKVLAENHSLVPDSRRRFVDEVGLLATIDSPSVAKIYELGETDTGQPYMVLELADRGDLRRRLEEIRGSHQVLNRSDLTMLAHHLHEALTTLHQADIVHRDVSPGNILIKSRRSSGRRIPTGEGGVTLLEPGERFLLADLGHAKDLILASGFTAGGGTRGYASPEQRDDVTVVDHRADIFSATAVLEWAAHDGKYAEQLEPFFDIGLAAEPDDRFDTMAEWHAAFCDAIGAGGSGHAQKSTFAGWDRFRAACAPVLDHVDARAAMVGATAVAAVGLLAVAGATQLGDDNTTSAGEAIETAAIGDPISPSTVAPPGLLRVKAGEEETAGGETLVANAADAETTTTIDENSSTTEVEQAPQTTDAETTTTLTETTATEPEPATTQAETTVTVAPSTAPETTVDPQFAGSPLADVVTPVNDTIVVGDLVVTGRATYPGGLRHVELLVKNLETGLNWNPLSGAFEEDWLRFAIPISGSDDTAMDWQFTIPSEQMEPGEYLIRAWARGSQGEGDPRGQAVNVVVR